MSLKKNLTRRTFAALAVTAIGLTTLSACGDSQSSADASETASLRIAVAPIQFETAYIAEQEGFFQAQGLDVEIVNGADPAALLAQVVSGDVDIAIGSWINVATSYSQGVPIQVIGGNGMVSDETDNSGVLVSPDSGIKSLSDLKGKTIGVVGVKSGGDIPVLQALEGAGISVDEVSEVAIPYAGMQAALEQKTVDAVVPADSFYHQMLDAGFISISNPVREYQGNMPVTVWTAKQDWVGENAETANKFLSAMEEAVGFYEDDANLEKVREVHAQVNQIDASGAPTDFVPADVTVNKAEAQSGIDAMVHFGLMAQPVDVDDVLWDEAKVRDSATN